METAFFGRHLKILKGLTPYEFICQSWMSDPGSVTLNPRYQIPGIDT